MGGAWRTGDGVIRQEDRERRSHGPSLQVEMIESICLYNRPPLFHDCALKIPYCGGRQSTSHPPGDSGPSVTKNAKGTPGCACNPQLLTKRKGKWASKSRVLERISKVRS